MSGSMDGAESSAEFPNLHRAMSRSDLQHHIDVLMNKERVPSSRMKLLITLASTGGSSPSNFRILTEALTLSLTARWTCWEEKRYSGTEAFEWRTCIVQAAGNTTGAVKEVTESFVSLGVKASTWCTEVVSADLQGRVSERELPAGGLSKIQIAALKLVTSIVEGIAEIYSPTERLVPKEPLASLIETLISSSFGFVKVVYLSSMKNPSQSSDNEGMRKRCYELLNLIFRLVYTFRRHVGSHQPGGTSLSLSEKREDLEYLERGQPQATSLRIVASSIKSLAELGHLSTRRGAVSLGLLNVSWKSVAALLQMEEGRDLVASAVDITHILTSLLDHAIQALKVPVTSWLSPSNSGEKDARRLCIPVKFFLQMVEKISSSYPRKAILASTAIIISVSKVLASLLLQYKDDLTRKMGLQNLSELIIPSALDILHHLLTAESVEEAAQVQLLQLITCDEDDLWSSHSITDLDGEQEFSEPVLDELFSDKSNGLGLLKTGRLALFISLLQLSSQYSTTLLSELSLKLDWLLEAILEPGVYVLLTQVRFLPVWTADGKVTWNDHVIFTWILNSLKTFAGVAAKDANAWTELQHFLFENVLHPCAICREVVLDLWCFIARYSEAGFAQRHLELLFTLLQDMVSAKTDVTVQRRLARVLCVLLEEIPEAEAAHVHASVFNEDPFSSESTANLATVLLEEGYSFTLFSDGTKKPSMDRFLSSCIALGKGLVDCLKQHRSFSNFVSQKQALTCLHLFLCQSAFRGEEIEDKYLQEVLVITQELLSKSIQGVIGSPNCHNEEILSHALQLVPYVQHLLHPSFIQTLLPNLYEWYRLIAHDTSGKELKQTLPEFLANLAESAMTEEEENSAMRALWGLYHLVLKEKHWALVRMGLASFSHFAANTSCQELWRFVPEDAALAVKSKNVDTTIEVFMNALKSFIEKEGSLKCLTASDEEVDLLRNEGALLQKNKHGVSGRVSYIDIDEMDVDRVDRDTADIHQALDLIGQNIEALRDRLPNCLAAKSAHPHQWQSIRSRLANLKEDVNGLPQLE